MKRWFFTGMVFITALGHGVQAQSLEAFRTGVSAYYRFADPSDITIEVKVWGAVRNAGLYEVRQGMNLSTLLSLAGGPQTQGQDPRTSRIFTVRLYRVQSDGTYHLLTETRMEDRILTLDQDPALLNGDILVSEEQVKQRFGWRDALSIVTAAATIVLVIDSVLNN